MCHICEGRGLKNAVRPAGGLTDQAEANVDQEGARAEESNELRAIYLSRHRRST
jgi:hypothetical protein